jgi:hypothetical protein
VTGLARVWNNYSIPWVLNSTGLFHIYIIILLTVDCRQNSFGLASGQVLRRSQGTLLPCVNPRYRICGTMCNARSNLIRRKHFDLERVGFASNLRKSHESTSSTKHRRWQEKERETQSRDWIGCFVEVPKQRRIKQTNLITSLFKSWLPFQLRRHPPF